MTAPNANTLWARALVDELAAAGVTTACVAPGSRSTPVTAALAAHDDVETAVHLDERSAAYFALGRARRTGRPTPVVCTSGTAAANFHPAVVEADEGRVPLLVLTADRPPELQDSGANQTVDQQKLYGDAVRWYRTVGEPEANDRKLRSLRTTAARAVAAARRAPAGPVHLNLPFRKPLEPTAVPGDVPGGFADEYPLAARGRDGPYVRTGRGRVEPDAATLSALVSAVADADRGLVVAGPADPGGTTPPWPGGCVASGAAGSPGTDGGDERAHDHPIARLARATGFPLLADPLSGLRFGPHVPETLVVGGYDSVLGAADDWPDPDVVMRFGASPTSKRLRKYLAATGARQFLVDPAGGWREAEFAATDLVAGDAAAVARAVVERLDDTALDGDDAGGSTTTEWRERFAAAEEAHWVALDAADDYFEGSVLREVLAFAPDPATVFVSNSNPVRDADRYGRPRAAHLTALANRGASGIDGVTSTALGAGHATDDPLVAVLGDLAYYHDMNGLLALGRVGVDATVVLVDNDGGGIFHRLPIEDFDPPFTDHFRTPHGLDFEPTADLYDLAFERVEGRGELRDAFEASVGSAGTQVLAASFDGEASQRTRERLDEAVQERVREVV